MYQVSKNSMTMVMMTTLLGFLVLSSFLVSTHAAPMAMDNAGDQENSVGFRFKRSLVDIENPKEVLRVLDILAQAILDSQVQSIMYSNGAEKRGIDLGMNRGFSGRQAARHLVGLASAQFAGGPGKK